VHLNPARARLLRPEQPLSAYAWSSWPEYLKTPGQRPVWLRVDRLLGEYRIPQDSAAGRRHLVMQLEQRRAAEAGTDYRQVRRGWCLGNEAFRQELLAQMSEQVGENHYAAERQESGEAKARGIVAAELQRRRKGDPGKIRIAGRLRAETTMTLKWIAAELQMGAWTYVSNLLSERRPQQKNKKLRGSVNS